MIGNFDSEQISIVMPCCNAAPYVEEAIECVLEQSHPQVELIIVDDGSTGESTKIIERLSASNPGLIQAHGNFVAFLDADDIWHPDAADQMHAAMTETVADQRRAADASAYRHYARILGTPASCDGA